jgi:glycerophosphoryl diester phosphodiesterase
MLETNHARLALICFPPKKSLGLGGEVNRIKVILHAGLCYNLGITTMPKALNIAHRGFTKNFPDNTLEAFRAAIELGADGIEFDVHETADNHFIIFHDSKVEGQEIAKMTLAQIQSVRLAGKYKIPTLEETLDLCRNRLKMLVEIKQVRSLDCLLSLLRTRAELKDVIVISFNRNLILELATLAPEFRRGILTYRPVEDPAGLTAGAKTSLLLMRLPLATPELVEKIHALNLSVFLWDCAGLEQVRNALKLGVEGIISDSPDLVRQEQGA